MKQGTYLVLLVLGLAQVGFASDLRVRAMAGLKLTFKDKDQSLNLYDFGNNPAWLVQDEQESWLKIIPSFNSQSGDYRRMYDPEEINDYSMTFDGVKALGEKGTFRGYTTYRLEQRDGVYRSLNRDPYAGEAFYMTDTTKGNFKYNGPTVGFEYSLEIFPHLYGGATIRYQILDGLKNIYSLAKTMYREVGGSVGLAYQPLDNLAIGVVVQPFNSQEKIESKSVDLLEVEIYNYRGDTYATKSRRSDVNHTIRKKGILTGGQLYWQALDNMELGVRGEYSINRTYVYVSSSSFDEIGEGDANGESFSLAAHLQYELADGLLLGASAEHFNTSNWSKGAVYNLLLWEWAYKRTSVSGGVSYWLSSQLLVAAEYEFAACSTDSSKYIDNQYCDVSFNEHSARIGIEHKLFPTTSLRAGYAYTYADRDLFFGQKSVAAHLVTFGIGAAWFSDTHIDLHVEYGKISAGESGSHSRSVFNTMATVTLLSF